MIMLGAYLEASHALDRESILASLSHHGMRPELLKINREALQKGQSLV